MERVIYTPPGGPPQGPPPDSAIYRIMGEGNIFRMMRDFYKELENSELRPLFPPDMEQASMKSAAFFVTILGGPPLYAQKYGPTRMRARHLPFEFDERAPDLARMFRPRARRRRYEIWISDGAHGRLQEFSEKFFRVDGQ